MIITNNKDGFTLVELAIVIVIIGFLVAGIAAGSNMIKQAQLRSIVVDFKSYKTAYNNFVGRFNKVPGDLSSASSYFAACAQTTNTNCDGDGDGIIEHGITPAANEPLHAWRHLALAGMIGAGIELLDAGNLGEMAVGTQAPSSKKSGAGFVMAGGGATDLSAAGTVVSPFANSTNAVFIGNSGGAAELLITGALTAEEAFNMDQKLDDALIDGTSFQGATSGTFRAIDGSGAVANDCANGNVYSISNLNSACLSGLAVN